MVETIFHRKNTTYNGKDRLFVFPMRKQEDDVDDLFEKKRDLPFAKSVFH